MRFVSVLLLFLDTAGCEEEFKKKMNPDRPPEPPSFSRVPWLQRSGGRGVPGLPALLGRGWGVAPVTPESPALLHGRGIPHPPGEGQVRQPEQYLYMHIFKATYMQFYFIFPFKPTYVCD